MAGREVAIPDRAQKRPFYSAALLRHRAAGMERAAGWLVHWAWHLASEHRRRLRTDVSVIGDQPHQGERIGVARCAENAGCAALLDDAAEIHHGDRVAEIAHH